MNFRTPHGWVFLLFVSLALLSLLALQGSALAHNASTSVPAQNDGLFVSSEQMGVDISVGQPWTAQRMASAKSLDISPEKKDGVGEQAPIDKPTGKPGFVPGGLPEWMPASEALEVGVENTQQALEGASPTGYSYPPPFTRFEIEVIDKKYKLYPFVTIGKLFFTQAGSDYVCSAASIGGYAIWTAGHCVYKSGWSYNIAFVPSYKDGKGKAWNGSHSWTFTQWMSYGNHNYDMGGVILYPQGKKMVSQKVGYLGFAWNGDPEQHWWLVGYPQDYPFNGQRMFTCNASLSRIDYNANPGPDTIGAGCDMTGGASGGPWIYRFGTGNYLNGNNSYKYVGYDQEIFSPYFGDDAHSLYTQLLSDVP